MISVNIFPCYLLLLYIWPEIFLLLGKIFSIARIEELCANPSSLSYHEQIHNIIMFLKQSEGLSKHVDSFMQILSLVQFKDTPPFFLTRLLPDEMNEADFLRL